MKNTHNILEGFAAIEYAEDHDLTLSKYNDPTEDAREGLTPDEARAVAREDPKLIWLDMQAALATMMARHPKSVIIRGDQHQTTDFWYRGSGVNFTQRFATVDVTPIVRGPHTGQYQWLGGYLTSDGMSHHEQGLPGGFGTAEEAMAQAEAYVADTTPVRRARLAVESEIER